MAKTQKDWNAWLYDLTYCRGAKYLSDDFAASWSNRHSITAMCVV